MMKKLLVIFISFWFIGTVSSQEGFGGVFDSIDTSNNNNKAVSLNGNLGFKLGSYLDNRWNSERVTHTYADLNLLLTSKSVEAKLALTLNADNPDSALTISSLKNELYLRTFFSFGYIDMGLMKTEWGKGDGIHVIDPLNPLDQSNGISSDLNEMKRPEIMAKMNFYLGDNGLFELVYKPFYHSVETASAGNRWNISIPPYTVQDNNDTEAPAFSQAAGRITTTLGIFDLGGMYYYGFMTEPGMKLIYTPGPVLNVVYTKAQLFGIEAGWALGPFTFRTEGGYWLTEDHAGRIAYLYNDRTVWLAGFDVMVPGTTLFVSIQEFGSYVMNFEKTDPSDVDLGMNYKNNAMTNTVITSVESSFYQDKMKFRLAGLYLLEANGYMLMPTYTWMIEDDLEFSVEGQFFGGDDIGPNPYYAWRSNDNVTLGLKYIF